VKKENFLNYREWHFAKILFFLMSFSILLYFYDSPIGGRRGNTLIGYSFGIFAAIVILYLTYFGIRKRSYKSGRGDLVKILSSHVWLGLSLIIVVPFHSGFHFGANVHTLTYVVMLLVVISGIFGAIFYRIFPYSLNTQRGGDKLDKTFEQVSSIDEDIEKILIAHPKLKDFSDKIDFDAGNYREGNFTFRKKSLKQERIMSYLANLSNAESSVAIEIVSLVENKVKLINYIINEARANAFLKIWLVFHIPLTFLLLVLLFVHIFSTLMFRT